jgi:uncharacterized protein YyaL (SSP411 family)
VAAAALDNPAGMGQAVLGLDHLVHGSTDVVVVGPRASAEPLVAAAFKAYLPRRTVVYVDPADAASVAAAGALAEGKAPGASGALAYVCKDHACSAPVGTAEELSKLL